MRTRTLKQVLLTLIFLNVGSFCSDTANYYIVNKALLQKFPRISYDILIAGGQKFNLQPVFTTNVLQPKNTNYIILSVSTQNSTDNFALSDLILNGYIYPIFKIEFVSHMDDQREGIVTETIRTDFAPLPSDIDLDWSIMPSTK